MAAISVLSNVEVTPEQLTWLMEQFKATKSPYGDDEWTIELAAAS